VVGVVGAFEELGKGSLLASGAQLAPERVMSTIAEALVATALGLVVAIPAVAVFNYFQGLLATTLAGAETLGHVLLTHLSALDESKEA
jgi:biopolymer transport protein ExbB